MRYSFLLIDRVKNVVSIVFDSSGEDYNLVVFADLI